jgi:hypothetical protein
MPYVPEPATRLPETVTPPVPPLATEPERIPAELRIEKKLTSSEADLPTPPPPPPAKPDRKASGLPKTSPVHPGRSSVKEAQPMRGPAPEMQVVFPEPQSLVTQVQETPAVQKVRELSAKPPEQAARPRRNAPPKQGLLNEASAHKALAPERKGPDKSPPTPPRQEAPTTVKIHIGRIEIKAVQAKPEKAVRKPGTPKPKMSLDQFLKDREG